jgi:hypothetical protein
VDAENAGGTDRPAVHNVRESREVTLPGAYRVAMMGNGIARLNYDGAKRLVSICVSMAL